jgi:hypothetical protein
MTQIISGIGLEVQIITSVTFPGGGFIVTQFADDADPFDIPSMQVADGAMGSNGDLLIWSKAIAIDITLNVIANSEDDRNLAILLEANRAGRGKIIANDLITMTAIYPDGSTKTFTKGAITNGMLGISVASAGRFKSKAYQFKFENTSGVY